ncbi:DUF1456 family protein [Aeromonas simiae]|uniref:DUF1456 family protein n=1 Tax=Aeromonas simiae TaxID=218936 RepID=UPI0005A83A40|nr:DUF1456 family protein [Aeromonas simiae]MDO2949497.1 DUF1456 family protein [Aeromonas simiae]MDO2953161.1 DUF1456 family protein [Aeromonas simiae]MDO2956828.1 DUF1456 family protein [Aeromonas simiae]
MTNNDILRRLRYALSINNDQMVEMFAKGNLTVTHAQLHGWLMKEAAEGEEQEAGFVPCPDAALSQFLDGLIAVRRGVRDDAPPQVIPNRINNNLILRKLRIALNFKEEEMLGTLKLADFNLSKSELTALFRSREHKHYQDCGDQILRNFLIGLTAKYRG